MLMRILAIYLLLVAGFYSLLYFSVPQNPTPPHKSARSGKTDKAQNVKSDEAQKCHFIKSEVQTPHSNDRNNESTNQSDGGLYQTYLVSGTVVAIAAIGTGFVVWKQVVALKNIERAWIVLKQEPQLPSVNVMKRTVSEEQTQDPYLRFICTFVNKGKTPARITGCNMQFSLTPKLPKRPS
jgi:hypothetical protein